MFHFKQFSIFHQSEGLKVNTDGCLLGALANHRSPNTCLDIGTGTGVIAMMLAQKFPESTVTAIELNHEAFQQAQLNIAASKFKTRINLIEQDIGEFSSTPFDLIVCNPPYFKNHLKGPDSNKNMALHSDSLSQEKLVNKVDELLKPEGLFWVVYPPKEMESLIKIAKDQELNLINTIRVENKAGQHYRSICCFSKRKQITSKSELILMDDKGARTAEFSEIMKDFYL